MSFMSSLGQLEVKAEQEGLKLYHAAADWTDHLTWDQVRHLLLPEIKAARPDVLAAPAADASTAEKVEHAAAAAFEDGAGSGESFEDWTRRQLGELGRHLSAHAATIGSVVKDVQVLKASGGDADAGGAVTKTPAKKAASSRRPPRSASPAAAQE